MNKRKLAVQYFACLLLAVLVLFYSSILQPCHISHVSHVGPLRRPLSFPGALFLRFVLFWLRRCGVGFPWDISIGIGAWTTCIFVQTCCLVKFRGFSLFWWLLCVSHPVIHNSLWHRRLPCTCRGSQLFSFLEVLGNNRPFYSCGLRALAFERTWGWGWPCFDTNLIPFIM